MDIKEIVRDIVQRELREGGMQAVPVGSLERLEARLAALEGRPPVPPADLTPLTARLAALEQAPPCAPPGPAPGVDLSPLEARLTALESALGINSEDAP